MKAIRTLREMQESGDPETYLGRELCRLAESIKWDDEGLSFKKLRDFATRNFKALGESNPSQAWGQLLRAGIQQMANGWYERTQIEGMAYTAEASSNKRQEFYAPLYGAQFPTETGPGEPYRENRLSGVDRELINRKFMGGESFDRELFDDDQTGQIRARAQKLGEGMKLLEELWIAGRLGGAALTSGNATVPASNYTRTNANGTTITGPFSVNFYATGVGNRLATFAQLNVRNLVGAIEGLMNAVDPLGIRIAVRPNSLVTSNFDFVNARTILNSSYYPGVPGGGGTTASSAVSGSPTGAFADNILKGMLDLHINTFLPRGSWYVGEKKKGLVLQRRDPLEVVQEVPNSGASFNTDTIRLRSRARWEVEWIDASFWFQGNDGSAALVQ